MRLLSIGGFVLLVALLVGCGQPGEGAAEHIGTHAEDMTSASATAVSSDTTDGTAQQTVVLEDLGMV